MKISLNAEVLAYFVYVKKNWIYPWDQSFIREAGCESRRWAIPVRGALVPPAGLLTSSLLLV